MSLKDTLPLLPGVDFPKRPAWVVESFPVREDRYFYRFWAPADFKILVIPQRSKASDIGSLKARKFVELLKEGVKPGEAAHRLHTSVKELMSKEDVQKQVKQTVETFHLDAAARRLWVRALANKVAAEADAAGDSKLTLEAIKIINNDSEVGINNAPQVNATIAIDPILKELLDRTIPLPIEAPLDVDVIENAPETKNETNPSGPPETK